ncbi:MAG: hypothetical protein JSR48_08910 [Verrucomicrobia bacterium]|nr:hypothetical protein [Verrucomicrobiota bacterium]
MKTSILIVLLVLSISASGVLWRRVTALEKQLAAQSADYPLGEMMGYMQRYADKLWYAEEAGNWELAEFYRGEIAEIAEGISQAHVTKDGAEVSKMIGEMLPPAIEEVTKAVAARDSGQFRRSYQSMVTTCNGCHEATKHDFIRISIPAGSPLHWNQAFSVNPTSK